MSMKKLFKLSLAAMLALSLVACGETKNDNVTFNEAGTFDTEETLVSADITADDVILSNKTIDGDLYINVPGNGSVTLSNVTVKGSIYVNKEKAVAYNFIDSVNAAGSEYTINLFDVVCNNIEIENFPARLVASGSTNINMVKTNSGIILQEQNITKNGFNDVTIMGGSEVDLTILAAGIRQLVISNTAMVTMITDSATLVEMVQADSPVSIYGGATINVLQANSSVIADVEPGSVIVGANGAFNGKGEVEDTTVTTTTPVTTTTKPVTTTKKPTTTTTKKPVTTVTTTTKAPVVTTTTTTTKKNTAPEITAEDVTLLIDGKFNPLTGVTIYDAEDGNITVTNAHIRSNPVNVARVGTYSVVYVYTDKGGLTTTYTRTVKVTNTLDMPTNLALTLDKNGDLVVSWDAVENVYYYYIYVDGVEVDQVSRTKNSYTIDFEELAEEFPEELANLVSNQDDFVVGVSAEPKDDEEHNGSNIAKIKYYFEEESETIPEEVEVSNKVVSMNYRIPSLGVPVKGVYAEVTLERDDISVRNVYVSDTDKTDISGTAEVAYDRDKGVNLKIQFTEVGNYKLTIKIKDDDNNIYNVDYLPFEIEAVKTLNSDGSKVYGYTEAKVFDWYVGDDWNDGYVLQFTLNNDFDLNDTGNEILVEFEWYSSEEESDPIIKNPGREDEEEIVYEYGGNEGTVSLMNEDVLGSTYVGAGKVVTVKLNSKSFGVGQITKDYNNGCKITVKAYITITDGVDGTEEITNSKSKLSLVKE